MDWVIEMKPVALQPEQRNATSQIAVDPIERIEAVWLRCPIEPESQATSDFGAMETFSTVIVRITSRSGVVGHGETKAAGGSVSLNYALTALIERELGPLLIGKNAFDIAGNWEALYNGIRSGYARAKGRAFPSLGRRGLTLCAIAGIDIALWDLVGRAVGLPASQLMGGRIRHSIPLYASGGWAPLPKIGDEVRRYVDSGFKAIKMRVGSKDGPVDASAARVVAARNAIGPSLELMVDAHGTFNVPEAKRFARLVQDANLRWFEEPVTGEDKEGLAEIRRSTDIPIAAGENEFTRFDFREYAERRALDVWQPRSQHLRRIDGGTSNFGPGCDPPGGACTPLLGWAVDDGGECTSGKRFPGSGYPRISSRRQSDDASPECVAMAGQRRRSRNTEHARTWYRT